MEKLKKLTSMGYLTYGSAVTPKDILLSPYRLWSDTGMLDIKTWGCSYIQHGDVLHQNIPMLFNLPLKEKTAGP